MSGDESLWAGTTLGSAWGALPTGWVSMDCRDCGAPLEAWDPASVGPIFEDDACRDCASRG